MPTGKKSAPALNVIFVTRTGDSAVGGGGKHRGYQIVTELTEVLGSTHVQILYLRQWKELLPQKNKPLIINRFLGAIQYRSHQISRVLENPVYIRDKSTYTIRNFVPKQFSRDYQELLAATPKPVICILDDARFKFIAETNIQQKVPTIFCPHNLESLDRVIFNNQSLSPALGINLVHELNALAGAMQCLFISKTEYALAASLGLNAAFYPYLPIGEIRDQMQAVASRRAMVSQEPGLFLLLGSANHDATRFSMSWLLDQIKILGLPQQARVLCVGKDTDRLLRSDQQIPGVELLGWVKQASLEDFLIRATAVLVPFCRGAGALTRLSELSCAGVPLIVSEFAVAGLDPVPGLTFVKNEGAAWISAMRQHIEQQNSPATRQTAEYQRWEARQPRTLVNLIQELRDSL